MNNVWLDIRYALRQLRKSPGFTLTAVLTLAFGIGATTAIFSIVEGVLLRPLPFPDPGRLVLFGDLPEGVGAAIGTPGATAPAIRIYTRDTHAFSGLGGYQQTGYELSGVGDPAQINASRLTASIFPALGVSPLMGRTFTQQEDEGSQQVAVISYQMWHSRFHGDMRHPGPEDPARPQALRDHRRHAARLRVSAGSGPVEPQRALGADELHAGRTRSTAWEAGTTAWWAA